MVIIPFTSPNVTEIPDGNVAEIASFSSREIEMLLISFEIFAETVEKSNILPSTSISRLPLKKHRIA